MKRPISHLFSICAWALVLGANVGAAQAAPSRQWVDDFVAAYIAASQPEMTPVQLEHYLQFLADDVVDHHVAYGVQVEGKDKARQNLNRKKTRSIAFDANIEDVILGSSTAVLVINETSRYYKDGEAKDFRGRTIHVMEFNREGQVQTMRRYLD